ncbi:unnamed protein product [Symbiodinium sp. CCMP2592]|nr:unnamed protein product [Symbiodinium sp. CCMP2592]
MAQLLLLRCQPFLDELCYYQYCSTGRQAQELILALRRLMRIAADWHVKLWVVKVDVRKAFDSIAQDALATMVQKTVAERGGQVWESRLWLEILEARAIDIYIGKSIVSVDQTNRVRQGSPDSAALYSSTIGESLQNLHDKVPVENRGALTCRRAPSLGAGYMDDRYLWSESNLAPKGNFVNVKKTQIICSMEHDTEFTVGGQRFKAGAPTDVMNTLGSPLTFDKSGVTALVADMQARGRHAFHAHRKLLCAPTALETRLKLLTTLVRNSATWGCATWPANSTACSERPTAFNSAVCVPCSGRNEQPRSLGQNGRPAPCGWLVPTYTGADKRGGPRMRMPYGHAVRHPGPTRDLLLWRNLKWWKEVAEPAKISHGGRFNSALDDSYVEEFDPPWASGRQASIANLTPVHNFQPRTPYSLTQGAGERANSEILHIVQPPPQLLRTFMQHGTSEHS